MTGIAIQQALQRFDAAIRIGTPPSVLQLLGPGIDAELVRTELASRALPTSAELEALYEWHNGTNASPETLLGSMWLLPGFYLLSLDESIADYDTFKNDAQWNASYFPVFADGGGDFYVLDFAHETEPPIRRFYSEWAEQPLEYESLSAMIETAAAAFEAKAIHVNGAGYVDVDDEAFAIIAAQMNPRVSWWTDPV